MRSLIIMLILLLPVCGWAQKVLEERWALAPGKTLSLKLDHADDIQLKGWDQPEVQIKAVININGGRHNNALKLQALQENEGLHVTAVLDESQIGEATVADCGEKQMTWQQDDGKARLFCLDITYEIWLPRKAALKLHTISGNVTANNLAGALSLYSISGFIDLSWPEKQQADLWLKSTTGELYTDLAVDILNKKEEIPIVGYEMKARLGSGGTPLRLETISSNIYLRKQ